MRIFLDVRMRKKQLHCLHMEEVVGSNLALPTLEKRLFAGLSQHQE